MSVAMRSPEIISVDSDEDNSSPSKRVKFSNENGASSSTGNDAATSNGNGTGPSNNAHNLKRNGTGKQRPIFKRRASPVRIKTEQPNEQQNKTQEASAPPPQIFYPPLSNMDCTAIQSVIMRNYESWSVGCSEYRMQFDMSDGPIPGKLRICIMAKEASGENSTTGNE